MTEPEEVIRKIKSHRSFQWVNPYDRETIIKALEKQIPKRPIDKTNKKNGYSNSYENCNVVVCPNCNGRLKLKSKGKYCDKCGQKLDFGNN